MKKIAAIFVVLIVACLLQRHKITSFVIYASGRSGCGPGASIRALENDIAQQREQHRVESSSRLVQSDGKFALWNTPHGAYWAPVAAESGLFYVIAEIERSEYGPVPQRGSVVLDCGANLGVFTRKALQAGASIVVAVEPVPDNIECLSRTFSREIAEKRVIVYPKGVWDKTDTLKMWVYENSALDSFVMSERPEEQRHPREMWLPVTTVDEMVAELGLPRVDFIKMDIEGAETNALKGASETLNRFEPRLAVATENRFQDYLEIPSLIRGLHPEYQATFGACRTFPPGPARPQEIRPEVAYFEARSRPARPE